MLRELKAHVEALIGQLCDDIPELEAARIQDRECKEIPALIEWTKHLLRNLVAIRHAVELLQAPTVLDRPLQFQYETNQ